MKSKIIKLVLVSSILAGCAKSPKKDTHNKTYMRSDSTARYSHTTPWLWYYAFRPYGLMNGGNYRHGGYYSSGIHESSNIGNSTFKSGIIRGGFGGTNSHSVSS